MGQARACESRRTEGRKAMDGGRRARESRFREDWRWQISGYGENAFCDYSFCISCRKGRSHIGVCASIIVIVIPIPIPIAIAIAIPIPIQTRSSLTRRFLLKLWKLAISSLIGTDLFRPHFEASIRVWLCLPFSLANCGFGMTCLDWLLPENECDCNWLVASSCALTTPCGG